MHLRNIRKLLAIALAGGALAAPAAALAGAVQTTETWSNEPTGLFYNSGGGFCTGQTVAGYGVTSGSAQITDTPNGGYHVRGSATETYELYEAFGPPWDVTFGDFVGTWTMTVHFDEQFQPGARASQGSVAAGTIVYADGSTERFQILFRLVMPPDGPPHLFLVKFVCSG
jgi:hypothetical protein